MYSVNLLGFFDSATSQIFFSIHLNLFRFIYIYIIFFLSNLLRTKLYGLNDSKCEIFLVLIPPTFFSYISNLV